MQLHVRMAPRDPEQRHRAATQLELFFDLTFVVAIAQAAAGLHHGIVDGHASEAVIAFPLVFWGIWWAWMNFTWFASAYDTDDAIYRVATLVQMTGVLILAAGIPRVMDGRDLAVIALGYVVMRFAMVAQWLRAAAAHPEGRDCARRYAVGIFVIQLGWLARFAVPEAWFVPSFIGLAVAEMAVPLWAESRGRTPWHPAHIAERYGLFTIIVLGESILAATIGVQVALDRTSSIADLLPVITGGLLIVYAMWWVYFDMPGDEIVERARRAFDRRLTSPFTWGYGHYFVFAFAAATGAGLSVAVDHATGRSGLSDLHAGLAVTVPAALYVATVFALHFPHKASTFVRNVIAPAAIVLILAASFTPEPVLVSGLVLAGLVAIAVATNTTPGARAPPAVGSDRV
jgi:low temperature requirement protein LtrA